MTKQDPRVRDAGEHALIRRLTENLPPAPDVRVGVGDDTAVVAAAPGEEWLLTSDAVIEGVHFLAGTDPEAVGHKAAGRVLSDLAAMGGRPAWALVNVAAPEDTRVARLEGLYRGFRALADRSGLAVVGGDTTRGPVLELHVFAVGRIAAGRAVLRSGARAGDLLYVTGRLGGSLRGRHLTFEPRLAEGRWLAEGEWARAMIDLSDGLAVDAAHVARSSGVRLVLEVDRLPVAAEAEDRPDGRPGWRQALADGEDYELLLAVDPARAAELEEAWRARFELALTRIGGVEAGDPSVELVLADGRREAVAGGFEHFRS